MKAVIYARYSSDNQREESIEGQLRECTAYCVKNDITILRTYIDRALSAKTDNRPDFQRMVKDSAKGLFDVVIVWKLDRFARNRYDSAHYKAQLRKYGVKVLSATENISEGPEGIILESMLEGMAEYYSAELSEKVIRGHTENALKCKYNGGTPTFGYVIDKDMQYQLDPRTAPVVLEIFTRYDQGATMKEIMEEMRQKGVTTVRGKKIDLNFMARLLKNRKYIGEYSYRNIVTPGGIPAIVPQDLFDRVQQRLAVNRKAPARHKAEDDYLLTTKLFCGTCGAMMVGESGTSSSKGRKYHYYRCVNTKKHRACDAKHKTVRKLPLENAVVNAVMAKIMDDNFVEYVADAVMDIQSRESSVLPALRKQLEEAESGITNMLNAIQMGIINASTKQRLDELEERKKDIELQIIQEEMKHPAVSREDVVYFVCRFRSLDTSKLDARRRLIDSFVNAVTIFDDYILITFNYKEGETRIDFADIESSDLQSVGGGEAGQLRGDRPELLGDEAADGLLPLHNEGQGGGLHPPGGELGVVPARQGPGDVEAHQPVGLAAGAGGAEQVVVLRRGPQVGEALPDGLVGLGGDPQPPGRPLPPGLLQNPPGHQLPLPARVGGDDQLAHVPPAKLGLDGPELPAGLGDHHRLHPLGQHGQGEHIPLGPRLVVVLRGRQLHQVPQGPGDDVLLPLQIPLSGLFAAQHPGQFPSYRGLFRQNQCFRHTIFS